MFTGLTIDAARDPTYRVAGCARLRVVKYGACPAGFNDQRWGDVPEFPSAEWIDAFCDQLAGHPRAAHAARFLGGVYRFVVDPGGPLGQGHQYQVLLAASEGRARVARTDDPGLRARVGVRTDYPHWQQLLRGQLDLGRAMVFGRIRVSGDLAALLNARNDLHVVVDALRAVETVWLENAV